jgi:hypothetical protein
VDQAIEDEGGFDRLSQADFVREQPAHRIAGGGALRHVELVGKEAYTAAEKRAETACFTKRQQVQDIQPGHEILEVVEIAQGKALDQRSLERQRPHFL